MATYDPTLLNQMVQDLGTSLSAVTNLFNRITIDTQKFDILNNAIQDLVTSVMDASLNIRNNQSRNQPQQNQIPKTIAELEKLIKSLNATITPFNTARKNIYEFATNLRVASNGAQNAGTFFGKVGDRVGAFMQRFSSALAVATVAVNALSTVGKVANFAVKSFASIITTSLSALKKIPDIILPFVEAFNPALVEAFNIVISDLMAVIGAGLQPVLEAFMVIIRGVADSLVPIIQKLVPAFQAAAEGIIRFFIPILESLFNVFNQLIPTINALAPVLVELASSIGNLIGALLNGMFPTINLLINIFTTLAEYLIPVINAVANLIVAFPYLQETIMAVAAFYAYSYLPAIIAAAQSLFAFGLELAVAAGPVIAIVAAITAVIVAFKALTSFLFGAEQKAKAQDKKEAAAFGTTGASIGATARKAEFTSVENLSKNLIKAAFSGSGNDKLRSIDNRLKELVDINRQQFNLEKGKPLDIKNNNAKQPGRI